MLKWFLTDSLILSFSYLGYLAYLLPFKEKYCIYICNIALLSFNATAFLVIEIAEYDANPSCLPKSLIIEGN